MPGKRRCAQILALAVCVALMLPGSASAVSWTLADGVTAAGVQALEFNVGLSSLRTSGSLATDDFGEYDLRLFTNQTINVSVTGGAGTDFILVIVDDDDNLIGIADDVGAGTESISHTVSLPRYSPKIYHLGIYAFDGGSYTLNVSMTDPGTTAGTARLAGADRYATAVRASQDAFASGSGTVVIASGANFPDALAAAGLCGAYDAPLLLVPPTSLPAVVSAEIDRLGATQAIIVGGAAAVSDGVEDLIAARPGLTGGVTRIAGASRYDTAKLIAEEMSSELGTDLPDAYLVSGVNFVDALAVSPLAYAGHRPILLTPKEAAHSATLAAIDAVGVQRVVIVGGTGAVSTTAENQVEAVLGSATSRVAGNNRFETARAVANSGVSAGLIGHRFIGVANGRGFADGLGGGVAAGAHGGGLVLMESYVIPDATQAYLLDCEGDGGGAEALRVYGGPGVIWGNMLGSMDEYLF